MISTFTSFISNESVEAASAVIDSRIKVTSVTKNSNGTITVKYNVKTKDAASLGIAIGYEWPSNYRVSDSKFVKVASKVGSHTLTIPKPAVNIIGTQNVVAKLSGRYSEKKTIKQVKNYPSGKSTVYKTISVADATAEYIVVTGMGVGIKFMKKNAVSFVLGKVYTGFITHYGLKGISVLPGFPPRVVGQYYKVESWYDSKGLNVKTTIWVSKDAFKDNHKPIYSGTVKSTW